MNGGVGGRIRSFLPDKLEELENSYQPGGKALGES